MLHAQSCGASRIAVRSALLVLFLVVCAVAPARGKATDLTAALGDDVVGPAAGDQYACDIERGGDLYLAVWVDRRIAVPSEDPDFGTGEDLYAARLDASGNLIDSVPIIISQDMGDQDGARICWNGENWLVTWFSTPPIGSDPSVQKGILATRISPDGEILDDPAINIYASPTGSLKYVATGSDGTNWAVFLTETVQSGMNTNTYLKGARITATGAQLGGPSTLYSPSCCYFFSLGADVAYANGEYFLVFECIPSSYVNDAVCGMRFTQTLGGIDSHPFEIVGTDDIYREPAIATDGTDYYVGWYHYVNYPPSMIDPYGARVTQDGLSLDGDGIDLSNGTGFGPSRRPRVAWDGTNWIVAWTDNLGARVARVTTDGVILDPAGVSFPWLGAENITDTPAGGIRMIWEDERAGGERPSDVSSVYVSGDLTLGAETVVSQGAPSHVHAAVAVGDGDAMLAFRSDVSGERRIMAQGVAEYGAGAREEPVLLASGSAVSHPEVAWNGTLYLAVWSDEDDDKILARRLAADGTIIDDPPISVMDGLEPDVAAFGEDFLVVATDAAGGPTVRKVYGARVAGATGTVLDVNPILLGQSYARAPEVAGMLTRWLVTWARHPGYDAPEADVWAAFVDPDGTSPGEFGIATSSTYTDEHLAPAIGASPAIAMIVWEENRETHGEDWNLYARRVLVDGTIFDDPTGLPIVTEPKDQRNSSLAWNGSNFQLAYEVSEVIGWFYHTLPDVYGTRVDQYGAVLSPASFAIENEDRAEVLPAVGGGGGEGVVVSSVFRSEAPYASYRLATRTYGDGSSGIPDGAPDDATSSFHLAGAYPNPATEASSISFSLPERANVSIHVYDVAGRLVRRLLDGETPAGTHDVSWDGRDESGQRVAAGLYLYRMEAGDFLGTGKLVLIR